MIPAETMNATLVNVKKGIHIINPRFERGLLTNSNGVFRYRVSQTKTARTCAAKCSSQTEIKLFNLYLSQTCWAFPPALFVLPAMFSLLENTLRR